MEQHGSHGKEAASSAVICRLDRSHCPSQRLAQSGGGAGRQWDDGPVTVGRGKPRFACH